MKYSKQREHILKTLRENVIHPTADEIYALARQGNALAQSGNGLSVT